MFFPGGPTGPPGRFGHSLPVISPHVRRILVIAPTPEFTDCRPQYGPCEVARAAYEADTENAWRALRALDARPKVELVDAGAWLCPGTKCPSDRAGVPLYRDQAHVTPFAAQAFAKDYLRGP